MTPSRDLLNCVTFLNRLATSNTTWMSDADREALTLFGLWLATHNPHISDELWLAASQKLRLGMLAITCHDMLTGPRP